MSFRILFYFRCKACKHDGEMRGAVDNWTPCPKCGADKSQFTEIDEEEVKNKGNFYNRSKWACEILDELNQSKATNEKEAKALIKKLNKKKIVLKFSGKEVLVRHGNVDVVIFLLIDPQAKRLKWQIKEHL